MPFRLPLSLKALVLVGSGLLSLCGVIAVAVLVVSTSYLHKASETIAEAVNSVVAAEELQKHLLEYSRDRMALALADGSTTEAAVDEAERRIRHWYGRAETHAATADEQRRVLEVQRLIEAYIGSRTREKVDLDPAEVFADGRQFLDPARAGIRDLVLLNQQQAEEARHAIARQDQWSDRLGLVISFTLFALIVALLYGMRQQVYKPLMALGRTIQAFGQGDVEARAAPAGPLELREISRVFNDLADGLKHSRENQHRFLAAVAHDLRNPLGALRMSFELVSSPSSEDPAEKRHVEAIAKRQIDQLDQMIGDLLDRSRIEAGKFSLRLERRDLRLEIEQAVVLHRPLSASHTFEVAVPSVPVRCDYDPVRISQVLNNLVSNAIKYSPAGGIVRLSLEADGPEAVIEVRDEGIGIAADELTKVFEPFRRSKVTRETIPGVGLGLAVARRLVEAHGGRLEVESREGCGATFRIRLPRPALTQQSGSIVAYISQTASDLVSRGGRSHAAEVPIKQG